MDVATFEANRGRMFGIAYRMLGSASEAEDIVQDAWLRASGSEDVENPAAFLATVVTRLCLTALDSARARRESYVGPWIPEPVSTVGDPTLGAERAEALSLAVVRLLERLTPAERAAYVLHEAFQYPFREVAEVLEISEASARQLGSRARQHIDRERASAVSTHERTRLFTALVSALETGNVEALEAVLAEDVVAVSDGGGVVFAARKPVESRERVAHFLLTIRDKYGEGLTFQAVETNGELAMLGIRDGLPQSLTTVDATAGGVSTVMIVMNPQKLASLSVLISR